MSIKHKIYTVLVNRKPGITYRYHKMHDGAVMLQKMMSWVYLLWLNLACNVLRIRRLGVKPDMDIYEEKRLNTRKSESELYHQKNPNLSVDAFVEKLKAYDVVSFDIFDTLIFRPLAHPTDVFYLVGEQLGILDFKNIRTWAEWDARVKCNDKYGHMEISLTDIWNNMHEDVGCDREQGLQTEQNTELELCYANPFLLAVWEELMALGREIIVVSDMYLPSSVLESMLRRNGFDGFSKLYVSCEYGMNKASGTLFRTVARESVGKRIIHVGDNPRSDQEMAVKYGLDVMPYQNVNRNMLLYRAHDMSPMVGSAYRAIVSNSLYSGLDSHSMEYEYGFIYGGLFVLGYCSFIHDYCTGHQVDKVLFLSRDGDILKQTYDLLFPEDHTEYVYWSRKAATKLETSFDKHDYFRRFIYHKVNQKISVREILHSMELDILLEELGDWKSIWTARMRRLYPAKREELWQKKFVDLKPQDELTDRNGYLLRQFIEAKWDRVQKCYANQLDAARKYYVSVLNGCEKAVAVDIGWAGSGALSLSYLVEKVWKIPCTITGMIAGTNTVHNTEPDASEPFLQSGRLVAYLYSQSHNRDLWKKHDPNKDYNVFWELLLSSPTPQFTGFYAGDARRENNEDQYLPELDITLQFGKYDINQSGIREIQRGILDFAQEYRKRFRMFPYMFQISGRDAYAPMLVAASHHEKYLKAMKRKFDLDIQVN